jgi:hypothetical protein
VFVWRDAAFVHRTCPLWRDLMEARCTIEAARAADRLLGLESPIACVQSRLFCRGRRIVGHEDMCEDYATARLDLASGAVIDLTSSWHLHAGRGAVIRATFYGTHAVAMENKDGFFLDFTLKDSPGPHTCDSASHRMSGVGELPWIGRGVSKSCRGYDPGIEQILEVAQALDTIYEHARR